VAYLSVPGPRRLPASGHSWRPNPVSRYHAVSEDGRLVVTVEEESDRLLADRITQFNEITGVLSAAMIYHHHESDQETAQ